MKRGSGILGALAGLLCLLHAPFALARGPATPAERAKVVSLARMLEQDPLHSDAPAARQWLRQWIVDVPDVRVAVCEELLGTGLGANYPYATEVRSQMYCSAAAYVVEHPEKNWQDLDMYRAGIEGALRVYEVLLRSRPDARSGFLDQLAAKRAEGQLHATVAEMAKTQCKRPKRDLIFSLAGLGVGLLLGLLLAWWFGVPRPRGSISIRTASASEAVRSATRSRNLVVFCAAYYVIVCTLFHFLQPEQDPRFSFVSGYVWGAHGWLMVTTFFALGLGAFTVALKLRDVIQPTWGARLAFGLMTIGAIFVCLAGVFKEFLPHMLASILGLQSLIMAVLIYTWIIRQSAGWRPIFGFALMIALGVVLTFIFIQVHVGLPGLLQRAFLFLLLLWLVVVVHGSVRVAGSSASGQS
jgi:hypothetical membrane protein